MNNALKMLLAGAIAAAGVEGAFAATKRLNFLMPYDYGWGGSTPILRFLDEQDSIAFKTNVANCGWYYVDVPSEKLGRAAVIARMGISNDEAIGSGGLIDEGITVRPIELGLYFDGFGTNEMYFVPDEGAWLEESDGGWYVTDPGIEGVCSYNVLWSVYDSDASLHPAFSCDGKVCSDAVEDVVNPSVANIAFESCSGVIDGLVQSTLDSTRRPVLTERGKTCFISENLFGQLFKATENVNETSCADVSLKINEANRWAYDSGLQGGFFPMESTDPALLMPGTKPLPAARTKRSAEGPEGWSVGPEEFGTRNQHFCMESHTAFGYMPGQQFSISGSDDIWVYIDGKLAIDLGGIHPTAKGSVELDSFEGEHGKLEAGKSYTLEIFSCNRNTKQSDLKIETSIVSYQRTASVLTTVKKSMTDKAVNTYEICYVRDESCGNYFTEETCAPEDSYRDLMKYYLVPGTELKIDSNAISLASGEVHYGGIDLTNPSKPAIDKRVMTLPEGRWTLFVVIDGSAKKIASLRFGGDDLQSITPIQKSVANFSVETWGSMVSIMADQSARTFAIMDMNGRVLKRGSLNAGKANVQMTNKGSFLVRVGTEVKRIFVK